MDPLNPYLSFRYVVIVLPGLVSDVGGLEVAVFDVGETGEGVGSKYQVYL